MVLGRPGPCECCWAAAPVRVLCLSWEKVGTGGADRLRGFCLQKKSKDHFGQEGDEESTMLEDSVSPKK